MEKASWIRKMFEEGARLKAIHGEENVFDFSLGNPDLDPPDEFFEILNDLARESFPGIHGYMPNAGFPDVKDAVARTVSEGHGVTIPGENIIMTCGAAGGLNVVLKTILNPGEEVIVLKPYFVEYGFYIDNHQGEMVLADTNKDFSLNIENIWNVLSKKTKAVLINSPNNPTGKIYTEEEIKLLSDMLTRYSKENRRIIYLISDEPYRDIVYDNNTVSSILKWYEPSIVVSSYSKTLSLPGERIGYIALNSSCPEHATLIAGMTLCNRILGFVNAPALMQRIIARLSMVTVNVGAYQERRDLLMEGLSSAGLEYSRPEGAFYIFCKSPLEDDITFVNHLQKFNILTVPGSGFGCPGYFRISYCVSADIIKRALPVFKKAMEAL